MAQPLFYAPGYCLISPRLETHQYKDHGSKFASDYIVQLHGPFLKLVIASETCRHKNQLLKVTIHE